MSATGPTSSDAPMSSASPTTASTTVPSSPVVPVASNNVVLDRPTRAVPPPPRHAVSVVPPSSSPTVAPLVSPPTPASMSRLSSTNSFSSPSPSPSSSSATSASSATASASSPSDGSKFVTPTLPPLIETPLWKKGSVLGGWSKRYYRFHPEYSRILYSKELNGPVRGEILLTRFKVHLLDNTNSSSSSASNLSHCFKIDCPNREYILRASDATVLQQWYSSLHDLARANAVRRASLVAMQQEAAKSSSSANTKEAAQRCASCQSSFGLLKSKLICASCGFAFCGSSKCFEPKSLDSSTAASERCCLPCAATRDVTTALSSPPSRALFANSPATREVHSLPLTSPALRHHSSSASSHSSSSSKLKSSNSNLLIRVISGKELMACDANDSSDPYVVIFIEGQEFRTEVQWKTLNPVWDQQFNIPLTGASKDIQIGVYDSDRYSNDDFMGFIQIPLSHLEVDRVYEDFYPLKPRPGKKGDKTLQISGAIHLQLIRTESIFSLFSPILEYQLQPEEAYSQAVLKHNIKRIQLIIEGLELSWYQMQVEMIFEYEKPMLSIVVLIVFWCACIWFPSDWILPAIPLLLLLHLSSNYIHAQRRQVESLLTRQKVHRQLGIASKKQIERSHRNDMSEKNAQARKLNDALVDAADSAGTNEEEDDDDDFEDEDEKKSALSFMGKMRAYQKQLTSIQNTIGKICDQLEAVQNLFRWHDTRRTKIVGVALCAGFIFLLIAPFRLLLFIGGTARWSKKLLQLLKKKLKPKIKKPDEVENFLARSPTSTTLNPMKFHLVKKLRG